MVERWANQDRCAVVGIGATEFSRNSGRSELTLATEATLAALADAGLTVAEVDGIVRCDHDLVSAQALADSIGVGDLSYWGEVGPGGAAPCAMVGQAVAAIVSGLATTVVVFRALNGRSGTRFGRPAAAPERVGGSGSGDEFFLPYGLMTAGQYFALVARKHMIDHGTTHDALARISVTCRDRAADNPAAQMHGRPLTMEDCRQARLIADPLRLYDFCLETDGACAVVVTTAERAADTPQPPVLIRSVAQGLGPAAGGGMMFPALLRGSITSMPASSTGQTLFRRAGLTPSDVDVAQLYDCFTITLLLQLEDYGFCKPGEAADWIAAGCLDLDGELPVNTAGGNLSEGYVHGMNHVLEGVRQIRGSSAAQVSGAEVALVTSAPPPGSSALLLVHQ